MKRLALLLPLLALAAAPARADDPATNAPSDDLRLVVTAQDFAGERLTFQIEAWHCIDSTNGTVVSLLPWLAEDGCGDGSTAFTMPQRIVVFRAISNQADRVRLLHAPPVRIRTGDRADLFAPGFDLAASVVENRPGIGLALLRDASSARESGTFPTPGAQSDFMSYSDVTRCFAAPSAGEGSPLAFLFLTVSGPLAEDAESESHAEPAESAETTPHAESAEEEASPEVAKSTSEVFDEIVDGVIAAVGEGRELDLRIPPADEWGNPFSVTNGPDFVKVESFGPDGKRSEDDFLLAVQWGDGFAIVRRVYFDEELKCQGEEVDHYDW